MQPLDGLAADHVTVDDLVDVLAVHVGVPDGLGIDDQHGSFLATVETAGLVDAHLSLAVEAERLDPALGVLLHLDGVGVRTASFRRLALVAAEEHVAVVVAHGCERGGQEARDGACDYSGPTQRSFQRGSPHPGRPASTKSQAAAASGQAMRTVCVRPLKLSSWPYRQAKSDIGAQRGRDVVDHQRKQQRGEQRDRADRHLDGPRQEYGEQQRQQAPGHADRQPGLEPRLPHRGLEHQHGGDALCQQRDADEQQHGAADEAPLAQQERGEQAHTEELQRAFHRIDEHPSALIRCFGYRAGCDRPHGRGGGVGLEMDREQRNAGVDLGGEPQRQERDADITDSSVQEYLPTRVGQLRAEPLRADEARTEQPTGERSAGVRGEIGQRGNTRWQVPLQSLQAERQRESGEQREARARHRRSTPRQQRHEQAEGQVRQCIDREVETSGGQRILRHQPEGRTGRGRYPWRERLQARVGDREPVQQREGVRKPGS